MKNLKNISVELLLLVAPILFGRPVDARTLDIEQKILKQLHIENVTTIIQPNKITTNLETPYAIQGVKENDRAPTCILINAKNPEKTLELISPTDGQFGNCHQKIAAPEITEVSRQYYATYVYVIEDPRAVFTKNFQLIKLTPTGFEQCGNDDEISSKLAIETKHRKKLKNAIEVTIKKYGCTTLQRTVP